MSQTINLDDLSYTITGYNVMGKPVVKFGATGETHDLNDCPTDQGEEAAKDYIAQYTLAYISGKRTEEAGKAVAVPSELQDLVGKKQTVQTDTEG